VVGFLDEDVIASILEDLGHLIALARPALGREIREGKADLLLLGRAARDDQAGYSHDRYSDEQCLFQKGPPEKRYYLRAFFMPGQAKAGCVGKLGERNEMN